MGSKCSQQKPKQFEQQSKYYQYVHTYSKKLKEWCQAISINEKNNLLFVGASQNIKAFCFSNKMLIHFQTLKANAKETSIIIYNRKKKFFISGSQDGKIIIWPQYLIPQQKFTQKICGHLYTITCMQLNQQCDLMISGSRDKSIKFWQTSNLDNQQYYLYQSINEHTNHVYALSINEQGNEVISCSEDNVILILEFSESWSVKQKIYGVGVRLCYLTNTTFLFQPYKGDHIEIYSLDKSKSYIKIKDLAIKVTGFACQPYFPAVYNTIKNVIIIKNTFDVNILRYSSQLNEIELIQSIDFEENWLYGTLSMDGQFLITHDSKSQELQIRSFQIQNQHTQNS